MSPSPLPVCRHWSLRGGPLRLHRPRVMGILNVTPDSFADGGRTATTATALAGALRMEAEGADLIDIGGESTRPGATPVSTDEECARVIPVIRAFRDRSGLPISVDTSKAAVAREALAAGANAVNDVSALRDPAMAEVVRAAGAGLVLMHSRGTPETMSRQARYEALVEEVVHELGERIERALLAGIPRECLCLDPGFGFAKLGAQNIALAQALPALAALGLPLLVGASRKSFVGLAVSAAWEQPLEAVQPPFRPPEERLAGSLAFGLECVRRGAQIVRVHDVLATCDSLKVALYFMAQCGDATF